MSAPTRCPTCESPEPRLHPATQHEGEVAVTCRDPFHTDAPKLPYPTPTRLQLAAAIHRRVVRHYNFIDPETRWMEAGLDQKRTADVRELVDAGLAHIPDDIPAGSWGLVRLTPAGYAWAGITPDGAA